MTADLDTSQDATDASAKPIRVLHIVSHLTHGGIETWLMHIFRNMDPSSFQHEVLLERPDAGVHDAEAEALGVKLHRPAARLGRSGYLRSLDELLKRRRFDIVHSHMYLFTGLLLRVARKHRVPVRLPGVPTSATHAYYRFYCYVRPENLAEGWSRDRIVAEITGKGVPCYQGSCSEMYLEKAFSGTPHRPSEPLPVARELGETSLMFLVHPTLTPEQIEKTSATAFEVLSAAAK